MNEGIVRWMSIGMALILSASGLVACGARPAAPVAKAEVLQSDKPRLPAPELGEARVTELVAGNIQFAFDLYHLLFSTRNNLFCSPYSISLALAMTYTGARGETERQMAQALRFALLQEALHPAFNALDQALANRGEKDKDEEAFRLHIVNALWGQSGYSFLSAFLDLLAQNYGAGLRVLDFQAAPEDSRVAINKWVGDQTEEKIKDLLPTGSISPNTRLVLTNAIYFKAAWMHPFNEDQTRDGTFHLLDGSQVTVPMMEQSERLGYGQGDGYQVVELPYAGGELSMVILLPATGHFEDFASSLDAQRLSAILEGIQWEEVHLTMPKFSYDAGFQLKDALLRLGMTDAFSDGADFSGMDGTRNLFISDVYHKAFVAVDEAGTEAAAATAVVMNLTAAPMMPQEVRVDRPFIFLIRDIETGTILFLGHVVNPA